MSFRYAIIGAGRQGTAAAYDIGRFGEAESILMLDYDESQAAASASRLNQLLGDNRVSSKHVDAREPKHVAEILREGKIDGLLSGTHYFYNLGLTETAISTESAMVDLGGNSEVVHQQLKLSQAAARAGVAIIPDCGLGPGMTTSLSLYAMEQLDEPREVFIWDCGLPKQPEPPWNYRLTFSIDGLTNEYHGDCLFIREGRTVRVPALEELELIEFPEPIGTLEAFTTSGGITTAAKSYEGILTTFQNKTLRYPGHFEKLKVIQDLGLLETNSIEIGAMKVQPREVLHALWEPLIRAEGDTRDLAIIRILATGVHQGVETEAQVDLYLEYDEETNFTAMEQGTGWHAAILAEAAVMGKVESGVIPVEGAMTGEDFVAEAARRGFDVQLEVRSQ
ncbi:MAG: saccharopine dehydrogenase family protein [Anaerolineales bacterium]